MDVKKLLIDTLTNKFGCSIFLQGSMNDTDTYPDSFFTFFNNSTSSESFFDNKENRYLWDFDLNFYSVDSDNVNKVLIEASETLKTVNFFVDGKGHDVASDEQTHTGRGINILFLEKGDS